MQNEIEPHDPMHELLFAAYQFAGAHNAPVQLLDALVAAMHEEPFATDGLLESIRGSQCCPNQEAYP